MKKGKWMASLFVMLILLFGLKYIVSIQPISEQEAIHISKSYVEDGYIFENVIKTDNGNETNSYWNVTFHDRERNHIASIRIDVNTGKYLNGEIIETKSGKVVSTLK